MNQLITVLNNMFGFIFAQPIHISLRQMRILQVGILLNSQALLWYIAISISKLGDPAAAIAAYSAIALTLIPMIWKGIESLHQTTQKDS